MTKGKRSWYSVFVNLTLSHLFLLLASEGWFFNTFSLVQQNWQKYCLLLSLISWLYTSLLKSFTYAQWNFSPYILYNKFTWSLATSMVVMRNGGTIVFSLNLIDVTMNFFSVQIEQCVLCLRGSGFQTFLTHVHILDISKLYLVDLCAVLDVTTLGWITENTSCHYFKYWDKLFWYWAL